MSNVVTVRPIRSDADLDAAVARLREIIDAAPGTCEFDELEVLGTLVRSYEATHYSLGPSDPIAAIRFTMDRLGLRQADLIPALGASSRVSEILSGRRKLTVKMVGKLHASFGIPLESLVSDSRSSHRNPAA